MRTGESRREQLPPLPTATAPVVDSTRIWALPLDVEKYLAQRSELLHAEFLRVDRLAQADELPEASVTDGGLKITPGNNQASNEAGLLTRQAYGLIPRIKITDLLTAKWMAGVTLDGITL